MLNAVGKKTTHLFRNRATVSPVIDDNGDRERMRKAETAIIDSCKLGSSVDCSPTSFPRSPPGRTTISVVENIETTLTLDSHHPQNGETPAPTAFGYLSAANRKKLDDSAAGSSQSGLTRTTSNSSTMNESGNDTGSCATSTGSQRKKCLGSLGLCLDESKLPKVMLPANDTAAAGFMIQNMPTPGGATTTDEPTTTLDLSALHLDEHKRASRSPSLAGRRRSRLSIASSDEGNPGDQAARNSIRNTTDTLRGSSSQVDVGFFLSQSSTPTSQTDKPPNLSVLNLLDHIQSSQNGPGGVQCIGPSPNHESFASLDDMFHSQLDESNHSRPSPENCSSETSVALKQDDLKLTPPTSLNGTPVKLFSSQGPPMEADHAFMLPQQASTEGSSTTAASQTTNSFMSGNNSLKLYSAIGSLEDPLSSSYKLKKPNKTQDFPSALRHKRSSVSTSRKAPSLQQQSAPKKVTVAEPTKKSRKELFRPSSDAYTPRMGRRKIEYKPAAERTPVMTSSMGTLSRPNFSDALRRVAMILRQHIVKIEGRFEDDYDQRDGLFSKSMKNVFCETNFVVPRYRCTMVRVPMARSGMACGMKRIEETYDIPTENEIYLFAHRLFQTVQLSSECSIVSLIYVERMMEVSKVPLLASTWRPVFMAGLLLASKVWQDLNSWNVEFANVYPQFALDSINKLELQFLRMIKWDLYISSMLYAKYYFALRSLVDKRDFRQRYNRMVGGVDSIRADQARQIEERTAMVKEEAISQLSQSM